MRPEQADARIAGQPFVPVIVGGHIGGYSIARSFHEAAGVVSYCISVTQTWVVQDSAILRFVGCPDILDAELLLATLRQPPFANLDQPMLLVGTSDSLVETLVGLRDRLPGQMIVPYPESEVIDRATRKHTFGAAAARAGANLPLTIDADLGGDAWRDLDVDLPYPLIVKATSPTPWRGVSFPGKKKVHTVAGPAELRELLSTIQQAGYRDHMIIQDRIPGDDTGMRILTCYCDAASRVRMASFGDTLLEEHAPGSLGVPAAIITGQNPELVAQAEAICAELGWTGYANFDLKYDPRDGQTKFFELNPRLGRSNYYVTGAGQNTARWYIDDLLDHSLPEQFSLRATTEVTVYSVLGRPTLRWGLAAHPELAARVEQVIRGGGLRNPLLNSADASPRRRMLVAMGMVNFHRKFHEYYDPIAAAAEPGC